MSRYQPFVIGDVNAFFGLMLDNVANLLLCVGLLAAAYNFPATFALRYMLPGTAVGVLVGDVIFTWVAIRLANRTGHKTMTAMPLGIDTPSTLGMVFFVLGPAYTAARERGLDELAAAQNATTTASTRTGGRAIARVWISGGNAVRSNGRMIELV